MSNWNIYKYIITPFWQAWPLTIRWRLRQVDLLLSYYLFVITYLFCLFGFFRPTREVFTHMETSPWRMKGCKFWPMLVSEGSSACHTYCDTGHPLIMVISEKSWHLQLFPGFGSGAVLLLRLRLVATGNRTHNLPALTL